MILVPAIPPSSSSTGSLQIVGSDVSGSGTIPPHQPGDLLLYIGCICIGSSFTKPTAGGTVPDWQIFINASTTRAWSAIATADNHTTGTFNGVGIKAAVVVLRGHNTVTPIGGSAATPRTSISGTATVSAPAVTMTRTDGTSQLLHFAAWAEPTNNVTGATPAGYTVLNPPTTTTPMLFTKDDTKTDGAVTAAQITSGTSWYAASVEVLAP